MIRRLLLTVLVVVAGLILVVGGWLVWDRAQGPARLAALTNLTVPAGARGPEVRAYVARPQGSGPRPAVILIHEFYGLNAAMIAKADALAAEGYVVIAPDLFRGVTTDQIPSAIINVITTPAEQSTADLQTVLDWAVTQPDIDRARIAVAGFCFGGRASLAVSLADPRLAATVIFYGRPETDPAVLAALPGPVLGIFGGADDSIPLDEVRAFNAALDEVNITHTVTIYDGQPHAFVGVPAAGDEATASGQAWRQMVAFLNENLQGTGGGTQAPVVVRGVDVLYAWRLMWAHLMMGHH
jgi:carboxymethylenebutenolidase